MKNTQIFSTQIFKYSGDRFNIKALYFLDKNPIVMQKRSYLCRGNPYTLKYGIYIDTEPTT